MPKCTARHKRIGISERGWRSEANDESGRRGGGISIAR